MVKIRKYALVLLEAYNSISLINNFTSVSYECEHYLEQMKTIIQLSTIHITIDGMILNDKSHRESDFSQLDNVVFIVIITIIVIIVNFESIT